MKNRGQEKGEEKNSYIVAEYHSQMRERLATRREEQPWFFPTKTGDRFWAVYNWTFREISVQERTRQCAIPTVFKV